MAPFVGFRQSGLGRELGEFGLDVPGAEDAPGLTAR